ELEVFVGIEPVYVNGELWCSHKCSEVESFWFGLGLDLSGDLLNLDDNELSRLERRKAHDDVNDALVDVVLRCGFPVALDEVRLSRRRALERSLLKQILHERANIEAYLRPEWLIVWLEHDPLSATVQTLFDVQREPPDRDVFVFVGELV